MRGWINGCALFLSAVVLSTESSVCECNRIEVQSERQSESHIETISPVCYTYAQDSVNVQEDNIFDSQTPTAEITRFGACCLLYTDVEYRRCGKFSGSEQKMWKNRKQGDAHEEKKINHRL